MKALIVTIVLFGMIGCSGKDRKFSGLLSPEQMQAVMWDVIGADVFTQQFIKKDSLKNLSLENMQLQNKIFALHKVDRANFYKSYDYYTSHPEQLKVILDSMSAKAERDRVKMVQQHSGSRPK